MMLFKFSGVFSSCLQDVVSKLWYLFTRNKPDRWTVLKEDAAKMVVQHSTAILLGILIIGVCPTLVFSFGDSPLYDFILSGSKRLEKREVRVKNINETLNSALADAEESLRHLSHYEGILHGRALSFEQGDPGRMATLASWPADKALALASEGYRNSRASYLLSYHLCMRFGTPDHICGLQVAKMFRRKERKECTLPVYRTFSGYCNNGNHSKWGSVFTPYKRILPAVYRDGIWEPQVILMALPMKHTYVPDVSEGVQKESGGTLRDVTLATAAWTNLVAYDMSHTLTNRMFSVGDPIVCCENERWRLAPRHQHPLCMPIIDKKESKCFNYVRSMIATPQEYRYGPAQQMNGASHFLDCSSLYGSSEEVSRSLRTGEKGQIRLTTSDGQQSLSRLFSESTNASLFPGEVRLNTDLMGAAMHKVLANEHNRVASELSTINPQWSDGKLFQEARRIVIAELQHVTYNEWLPVVLGEKETSKRGLQIPKIGYAGVYNPEVNPATSNSFANAAMRFVTSLLDEEMLLYDEDRNVVGNMSLRFSLIEPDSVTEEGKFASLVRSLATQNCQANDLHFSDAVSKYMYSENGRGYDVLSLDIQRGRDHGIAPYTAFRKLFGLPYETFEDLATSIPTDVLSKLKKNYEKANNIDLIVGGLAETPRKGAMVGPVFSGIISQQMLATRIGDRYFYDNRDQPHPFTPEQLAEIKKITLARLLCDNTPVKGMQPHAFRKPNLAGNKLVKCQNTDNIPRLNLNLWKEDSS